MAELPPTAGLDVDDVEAFEIAPTERIGDLRRSIESVILGKSEVVGRTLVTLFAEGHLLIEDVPGVGKTMLAQALARSLDVSFRRLQFTSDLLPSDILGVSIYQPATSSFEFKPGPLFSHVLLADEINRATPKTQSAMLEAMNEAQVSVDSSSYPLAQPFIVLATQNPVEHQGTYPLPESQLDRFLMRLRMGYPDPESERQLLETQKVDRPIDAVEPVLSAQDIVRIQRAVRHVAVDPAVADYIVRLATATRTSEKLALGVSPRGSLLLQRASQAQALIEDRRFVVPDEHALSVRVFRLLTEASRAARAHCLPAYPAHRHRSIYWPSRGWRQRGSTTRSGRRPLSPARIRARRSHAPRSLEDVRKAWRAHGPGARGGRARALDGRFRPPDFRNARSRRVRDPRERRSVAREPTRAFGCVVSFYRR